VSIAPLLVPLLDAEPCLMRSARGDAVLATRLELAADSRSRRRGLLGRDHLDPGAALVIAPCSSVHTFFMRFPIDVLFVRRDGTVLKCVRDLGPWRIALAFGAYAVVEFAAGALRDSGTGPGDRIVFEHVATRG
jgi:uncharacterized membrane protein (UPF0127 family)